MFVKFALKLNHWDSWSIFQ